MNGSCPNCHSDQTQSARMALLEGTYRGEQRSWMFGLALREGLLPGLGWNQGQLELRSGLARCFALPPEPRSETAPLVFGLLFVLAGIVAVGFGAMDNEGLLGAGLLLLALGGILAWSGFRDRASLPRRREQWQAALDALDERWICHRCGHSWSPTPGPG